MKKKIWVKTSENACVLCLVYLQCYQKNRVDRLKFWTLELRCLLRHSKTQNEEGKLLKFVYELNHFLWENMPSDLFTVWCALPSKKVIGNESKDAALGALFLLIVHATYFPISWTKTFFIGTPECSNPANSCQTIISGKNVSEHACFPKTAKLAILLIAVSALLQNIRKHVASEKNSEAFQTNERGGSGVSRANSSSFSRTRSQKKCTTKTKGPTLQRWKSAQTTYASAMRVLRSSKIRTSTQFCLMLSQVGPRILWECKYECQSKEMKIVA